MLFLHPPQILNFPKHTARHDNAIHRDERDGRWGYEYACRGLGDVPSKIEVARRDDGLGQILTSGPIIAK